MLSKIRFPRLSKKQKVKPLNAKRGKGMVCLVGSRMDDFHSPVGHATKSLDAGLHGRMSEYARGKSPKLDSKDGGDGAKIPKRVVASERNLGSSVRICVVNFYPRQLNHRGDGPNLRYSQVGQHGYAD